MRHQGRDRNLKGSTPSKKGDSSSPSLTILGIDPGTSNLGYGIIKQKNSSYEYIDSGVIKVSKAKPLNARLKLIYDGLEEIIREHKPDVAVIEKIFFARGIKATLGLGYSRGIALLAIANHDIPLYEYSSLEVKKAVVGYGRAEKHQVSEMIRIMLSLDRCPPHDSADALALCICHVHTVTGVCIR
ncbi:MAG: crossover junction endodeoxyribonuclease RuvC [Thermodesulfovibrionales bacterium]|nr:crossover junction endodeoxyribonuclease RuvC [Thermodesulfovibrionales bacterium]